MGDGTGATPVAAPRSQSSKPVARVLFSQAADVGPYAIEVVEYGEIAGTEETCEALVAGLGIPVHSAAVSLSSVMPRRACSSSTIRRASSVSDTSIASGEASATALRRA